MTSGTQSLCILGLADEYTRLSSPFNLQSGTEVEAPTHDLELDDNKCAIGLRGTVHCKA